MHNNATVVCLVIFVILGLMLAGLASLPNMKQFAYGKKVGPANPGSIPNSGLPISGVLLPNNGIASPGAASPGLYVSQSTSYKDATGVIHIVGEVQNVFSFPVSLVKVTATIFGSNNMIAGITSSDADISQLRPGEKSGFQIVLGNPLIGGVVGGAAGGVVGGGQHYQLSTSYTQTSTPKPPVLNLILGQPYTDSAGAYHVVGEVINEGKQIANAVKVSTVFYDPKGKLVDETFGYTIPTDLPPGMAAQFDIRPLSADTAHKAKFASTDVQIQQFSSLNYNPSGTPQQYQQLLLGGVSPFGPLNSLGGGHRYH